MPRNAAYTPYKIFGPQKPGGRYLCGYWRKQYDVLSISTDERGNQRSITVAWEDGGKTTHFTSWDNRADKIIYQPE